MMPTPRALIVEDDPEVASFLRDLLKANDFRVRHAANGAEAVAAFACVGDVGFDVILLDWNLPFYKGDKLLELIRGSSRIGDVPVVVLTGAATAADEEHARALGVSAFLMKPSSASEILAALRAAASKTQPATPT